MNTPASVPAGTSIIVVANLIKQFGRFAALRGVSAEFDPGRFHAVLGENGAGKTTLLRALAGLAQPTQGTISIFGKPPREACRDIGYMAHPSLLYDEMSGMMFATSDTDERSTVDSLSNLTPTNFIATP